MTQLALSELPAPQEKEYRVDPETGCWVWQRALSPKGYPNFGSGRSAHRVYYERTHGPIPDGLQLDHLCRNRGCVNPDHLEAVTPAVNTQRGLLAKLTPEQVEEIRASDELGTVLADRYGVHKNTIYKIRDRETWPGEGETPNRGANRRDDARTFRCQSKVCCSRFSNATGLCPMCQRPGNPGQRPGNPA